MNDNEKLYIAYGSNLNLTQMSKRCPTARAIGTAMLKDWRLTFRRVATIEPCSGAETPVGVWRITPEDELALDRYEGFPTLYRKENVEVEVRGEKLQVMVYIMNEGAPNLPTPSYYKTIADGYADVGLDSIFLKDALDDTMKRMRSKKKIKTK